MLRLRKVELFGFKSFAERTRIVFNGTGVAAVVGPNGCGKSNIADAILWVLGEQSAKTLRSGRMADCIFNGTASRPPTNLAEVSLTLLDPQALQPAEAPAPPSEEGPETPTAAEKKSAPARKNRLNLKMLPGEVLVTRRLYRDGTSEYYLNGELCRLRDIQELFMGTGLGPESYAIIEQGRVGQILSSRPSDRRALLEEAAGVTKYKTKRRLAEAKLASAQQNLARVNDILDEVSRQLNSLKRQASRARRYQELKSEATALRRQLLATQFDRIAAAQAELAAQLEANAAESSQLSAALAALEQQHTAAQTRQYELEASLRHEQNRAGQMLLQLERARTQLADTRRQQEEVEQRLRALVGEQQTLDEQTAAIAARREQIRIAIEQLEGERASTAEALERLAAETENRRQQIAALEAEQQERQEQQAAGANRLALLRAEAARLEQVAASASEQLRRLESESEEVRQERARIAADEERRQAALARARDQRARAQENVTTAQQTLARCRQEYEAERGRIKELRQSLATARAQQQVLRELVTQRAALAEPVQKLLLGAGGSSAGVEFRAVGVVADFAEFESDYAPLLEDYLHDELEYVVVETYDAARTGVSLLRERMAGRATFLVDSFGRRPPTLEEPPAGAPQGRGVIAPLTDLVRMNGPLGSEAKRVLPKLGRTYLVQSAGTAEELARDYPQFFFLARDGTCYHGRLVSGGVRNGHGAHSLQRDLEQAAQRRTEIEPVAGAAEAALGTLEARRRELEAALDAARRALFAEEKNLLQLEHERETLAAEGARQENEEARAAEEQAACRRQQSTAAERLTALRHELSHGEQELAALEEALKIQQQALQQGRQQAEAASTHLADWRAQHAALEERLAGTRLEQTRLEENATQLAAQQQQQKGLETRLQVEQERLAQERIAREAEREHSHQEKNAQEARCQQCETELTELRQSLVEGEAALRRHRDELNALREHRHAFEVERARDEAERQHLELAAQSEFGLTAAELSRQVAAPPLPDEALAAAEARYGELKQRLDHIGPINMMALEEFQESEQRHQFLTQQREDLLASIADTTRAITEIDTVSRQRFERAFTVINQNFTEAFRTLFGGGTATLRLTDADPAKRDADCGVELICQPPGKRLQNVLLLSGGEKALAALALLIAVFRFQPSPFCILDEVDAPLDDTNVARFTQLIQQMASHTQFILITHNKKTMEIAPVLYGITMQGAVSQIVSVRFDEEAPAA
ncbi:MAG: chromosome segregation protein SMC [Terriglobia bacterium]